MRIKVKHTHEVPGSANPKSRKLGVFDQTLEGIVPFVLYSLNGYWRESKY